MRLNNSSKALLGSVIALVVSLGLASALLPRSYALTFASDFISLLIIVVAGIACLRNAVNSAGRTRAAWSMFAGMQALQLIGQTLWLYFEVILGRSVPNPFVGDILFFVAMVPAMAGVILRPHLEPSEQDKHLGTLDFTLLLLWWLYLYLFLVIPWQYVSFDEAKYGPPYNFLILVAGTVLSGGFALAWLQSSGRWRQVYATACIVSIVNVGSNYILNVAIDQHTYFTGSWYDMPTALGLAGWAVIAVVGYDLGPSHEHRDPAKERYWMWSSRLAAPVRLTLPLLAGWAFLDTHVPEPVRAYRVLLTLAALVILGLVATTKQLRLDKELARANQELLEASLTDSLTGVHNRRFFTNSIASDVQQALRSYSPNAPVGARNRDLLFYFVDADHFKEVNDRFGHDVGDQVLVEITRRISTAIRHSDALIRWGGEEFLVVSRYTNREEAAALAQRVLDAVGSEPFLLHPAGTSVHRTCSVGWAAFPWHASQPGALSYEQVLGFADQALYQAKQSGRNRAIGMLPAGLDAGSNVAPDQLASKTLVTLGPIVPKEDWPGQSPDIGMSWAPEAT